MSGTIHLKKWLSGQVATAKAGYAILHVDANGRLRILNDDGTYTSFAVETVNGMTGDVVIDLNSLGGMTIADALELIADNPGPPGVAGDDAYEVAVAAGFSGTVLEWLASLEGKDAYQVAVEQGFSGTVLEWLDEIEGADGKSAYQSAVDNGFIGTEAEWLSDIKGDDGKSAYEIALDNGFIGTEAEWLADIKGDGGSGGGLSPTYPPYAYGMVLKSTSTDDDPSGCYWAAIDSNSEDEPINSAQAYLQEKKYIKTPNAFFSTESGKYETEELIVANNGSVSFTFGQQLNIEEFDSPDPSNNEIVYAFEFSFIDATGSVLAYKSVFGQVSNSSIQFFLSTGGGEFINTDLVSVTVPEGEYRLKINCRISNTANCYVMNHIYVKTTGVAHSTNLGLYGIFKRAVNYI